MERILIIGNCGSGKSTFAKALAEKTGLPLVHLDQLYWYGSWQQRPREEFDALLQTELEKPKWIIDGNFHRTFLHRLRYCDTVFFLDMPTAVCLWGVTKRVLTNYGKTREDMGGDCPEHFDRHKWELFRGVLRFNRVRRAQYYEILNRAENVTIFRSRRQIHLFLQHLDTHPSTTAGSQ